MLLPRRRRRLRRGRARFLEHALEAPLETIINVIITDALQQPDDEQEEEQGGGGGGGRYDSDDTDPGFLACAARGGGTIKACLTGGTKT